MPTNKSVRGDDTNSSQPWMENVATTEFCQFVLPVTKGKAMLLFLSFLPSLAPHNSPPLPKNPLPALQGAAEPLLYSFLNLCHLFRSLSLSLLPLNRLQTTLSSPFVCLFLLQGQSGGFHNFHLPEAMLETSALRRGGWGGGDCGGLGRSEGSWEDRQCEET